MSRGTGTGRAHDQGYVSSGSENDIDFLLDCGRPLAITLRVTRLPVLAIRFPSLVEPMSPGRKVGSFFTSNEARPLRGLSRSACYSDLP